MAKNIFMYLFIFAVLIIIYQFVNSKNYLQDVDSKIAKYEVREQTYKDSIIALQDANFDLQNFSLDFNDDAMTYFEDQGYRIAELVPFIKDELYKLNSYEGDDHPIVPYASMTDNKMMINSVKLLNHKWIIANFTDGEYWGEMLLAYEIIDKEELKFTLIDYLMYRP